MKSSMTEIKTLIDGLLKIRVTLLVRAPSGLCAAVNGLRNQGEITIDEYNALHRYIIENKPFNQRNKSGYYWTMFAVKPRIRWIDRNIKRLNKQQLICVLKGLRYEVKNGNIFGKEAGGLCTLMDILTNNSDITGYNFNLIDNMSFKNYLYKHRPVGKRLGIHDIFYWRPRKKFWRLRWLNWHINLLTLKTMV